MVAPIALQEMFQIPIYMILIHCSWGCLTCLKHIRSQEWELLLSVKLCLIKSFSSVCTTARSLCGSWRLSPSLLRRATLSAPHQTSAAAGPELPSTPGARIGPPHICGAHRQREGKQSPLWSGKEQIDMFLISYTGNKFIQQSKRKNCWTWPHWGTLHQDYGQDQNQTSLLCSHPSLELKTSRVQIHLAGPKNTGICGGCISAVPEFTIGQAMAWLGLNLI